MNVIPAKFNSNMKQEASVMQQYVVMLVDDEGSFVEALSKRLKKRGYPVIQALSGGEALKKLGSDEGSGVDVVVLDVKMPEMGGIETLTQIRALYPLVETVMLTGHATVESAIEGMKQGAFDYLMKPCDMEILTSKINEAGKRKKDQEERIITARAEMIALRRGD